MAKKRVESKMVKAEYFGSAPLDIHPEMPLDVRVVGMRNTGFPKKHWVALATQDLASSMLDQLGALVEQSGNPELIEKANAWLEHWNRECEPLFLDILRDYGETPIDVPQNAVERAKVLLLKKRK